MNRLTYRITEARFRRAHAKARQERINAEGPPPFGQEWMFRMEKVRGRIRVLSGELVNLPGFPIDADL